MVSRYDAFIRGRITLGLTPRRAVQLPVVLAPALHVRIPQLRESQR